MTRGPGRVIGALVREPVEAHNPPRWRAWAWWFDSTPVPAWWRRPRCGATCAVAARQARVKALPTYPPHRPTHAASVGGSRHGLAFRRGARRRMSVMVRRIGSADAPTARGHRRHIERRETAAARL